MISNSSQGDLLTRCQLTVTDTSLTSTGNAMDLSGLCNEATVVCVIGILEARESLPDGFLSWGARRRGSRYVVVGNRSWLWLRHGGCSAPTGDTGRSFNFRRACPTHDLGYDLLRFVGRGGSLRRAVEALFGRDLVSHCRGRSIFLRPTCYAWADTYHTGVDINSLRQGYRVP